MVMKISVSVLCQGCKPYTNKGKFNIEHTPKSQIPLNSVKGTPLNPLKGIPLNPMKGTFKVVDFQRVSANCRIRGKRVKSMNPDFSERVQY
jgi:hypothetical protein